MARKVRASKWEPEARTEPAVRTEPAARTEPASDKRQTIKCPSYGYLLFYVKGTEKNSIKCTKCGNVFQVK